MSIEPTRTQTQAAADVGTLCAAILAAPRVDSDLSLTEHRIDLLTVELALAHAYRRAREAQR